MKQTNLDWLWIIIFGISGLGFVISKILGFVFLMGISFGYLLRRIGETSHNKSTTKWR